MDQEISLAEAMHAATETLARFPITPNVTHSELCASAIIAVQEHGISGIAAISLMLAHFAPRFSPPLSLKTIREAVDPEISPSGDDAARMFNNLGTLRDALLAHGFLLELAGKDRDAVDVMGPCHIKGLASLMFILSAYAKQSMDPCGEW